MTTANLFNQLLIWPIINLLIAFYKGLVFFSIPGAFGWAIILLTAVIRLLLYPLTSKQLKSSQQLTALKPQLDKLSQKFKHDKKRLQQEQLALYQRTGVNPLAGCLPLLLQFPVLIALFRVFSDLLSNGDLSSLVKDINTILYFPSLHFDTLNLDFFGIDLSSRPSQWQEYGIVVLAIPVITALLLWWQARLMSPVNLPSGQQMVKDNHGQKKEEKSTADEMQKAMQFQMNVFLPLFIGFLSFSFPIGLSLYWNTFTFFGIIQQIKMKESKL